MTAGVLDVLIAGKLAGTLSQDGAGSLSFAYERGYRGVPLSSSMPLSTRPYRDKVVLPYLWGLLPEDPAARRHVAADAGIDVVPQECPVGAHDQHVDDVEADLDVAVGRVACEPGRCRDLKVAALDLTALEAALAVLGCGDVDEDQGVVVAGDQVDPGSLGGSPTGIEKLVSLALDEAGGCLDCLLLKFEIAHDDLRLFVAGPFGLPCDPEAAQVLAEGKESSENPAGPEFCAAKVFRALPEEPGSERAWRSQGKAKEDVPAWGSAQ